MFIVKIKALILMVLFIYVLEFGIGLVDDAFSIDYLKITTIVYYAKIIR